MRRSVVYSGSTAGTNAVVANSVPRASSSAPATKLLLAVSAKKLHSSGTMSIHACSIGRKSNSGSAPATRVRILSRSRRSCSSSSLTPGRCTLSTTGAPDARSTQRCTCAMLALAMGAVASKPSKTSCTSLPPSSARTAADTTAGGIGAALSRQRSRTARYSSGRTSAREVQYCANLSHSAPRFIAT
jgi:hypothetical protein